MPLCERQRWSNWNDGAKRPEQFSVRRKGSERGQCYCVIFATCRLTPRLVFKPPKKRGRIPAFGQGFVPFSLTPRFNEGKRWPTIYSPTVSTVFPHRRTKAEPHSNSRVWLKVGAPKPEGNGGMRTVRSAAVF